jgi:acetyltransferase-like isoleucine patch superfamily enzyme
VVTTDIPEHAIAAGAPAKVLQTIEPGEPPAGEDVTAAG